MPDRPDLRQAIAERMARAAGSKAFDKPGPAWEHARAAWLRQASAALAAIREQYVPPPPGSDRDALPEHIRAAIGPHMPPYVSTAEQAADGCEAAAAEHPELAGELRTWAGRMRDSCRATRKQDMAPCAHPQHRRGRADSEDGG